MNNDLEKKLALLRNEYKKNLPIRIEEIKSLVNLLKNNINEHDLTTLHRKIHSLHGSSLTYGFIKLGEAAAAFEKLTKQLKSTNMITDSQFTAIDQCLDDLTKFI